MHNKLYVGNIPADVNEGTLKELFQEKVNVIPRNIDFKGGFAFVELPDQPSVEKSIEALNGYSIMGSQLLVEPSVAQNRRGQSQSSSIQISNIPDPYGWDEIHRLASGFGNILHCEKGAAKVDNTYNVFVTYESPDQAQQAYLQLNNFEVQPNCSLKVECMMDPVRNRGPRSNRAFRNPLYSGSQPNAYRPSDFPLRILVLSDMVGAIIGRAGGTIRQITQQSRARVDIHRKENAGSPEKVITIYGNPENCSTACQKILEVMQQEANNTNRGEIPLKILAHNSLIGRIIGKNGTTIKHIMEQTDTKITVSSSIHDVNSFSLERIITVKGKLGNIVKAEQMLSAKLRQSYENDLAVMAPQAVMFPGVHPMAMMSTIGPQTYLSPRGYPAMPPYGGVYGAGSPSYMFCPNSLPQLQDLQKETTHVYIPNSAVGAIIGTGGSAIRDMISSSNASIKVAQPNKDEPVDKQGERKVTIVGTAEAQWKAQFMIFKKVSFEGYPGPQEAHLRVEILVPSSHVGRIIGRGGQTVRELQRITHATIKFPQESQNSQSEETPVHIIGDFYASQAAQRQIRALISRNVYSQQRRRAAQTQNLVQT